VQAALHTNSVPKNTNSAASCAGSVLRLRGISHR
jgi:hypothetical protein